MYEICYMCIYKYYVCIAFCYYVLLALLSGR